jgi:trimeric autotransporter adhesin
MTPQKLLMIHRNPPSLLPRSWLLSFFALGCFALCPVAQAVVPAPDGGYPGGNTAEGTNALFSLTTGVYNTALGLTALFHVTDGDFNTATGAGALFFNNGDRNTAHGINALRFNTAGDSNTAIGTNALYRNTASQNTAIGDSALFSSTTGSANTATGYQALNSNTTGGGNTAAGSFALDENVSGSFNTAIGRFALTNTTTGSRNTALGYFAGPDVTTGGNNTCLGYFACDNTTTASNVVCIGSAATGENFSDRAYIPNIGVFAQNAVLNSVEFVTVRLSDGKLGHSASSRRYKEDIKPMGNASELIYKLKPVTFKFKEQDVDPNKGPQPQNLDYGLVAEDVAEIDPTLAIRDGKGQIESLRYMAIYNMMLNEFLKEHKRVQELKSTVEKQEAIIAQQQKGMEVLTAQLKEQAAQIQKVSAQLELNTRAPRTVADKQ